MQHIGLRTKLIAGFIFVVLLPLLISGLVASNYISRELNRQVTKITAERLHQVNMNIERELRSLAQITNFIRIDDSIPDVLENPATSEHSMLRSVQLMDQKFLQISTMAVNEPLYVTLLDFHGHMYSNWSQPRQSIERVSRTDWFKQTLEQDGYPVWTLNHDNYMTPGGEALVTQSMVIKDQYFQRQLGVLVVSQPVGPYLKVLQTQDPSLDSLGFIVDSRNTILGEDPERLSELYPEIEPVLLRGSGSSEVMLGDRLASVSNYSMGLTNWRVVQAFYYDDLFANTKRIVAWMVSVFVISLLFFFLLVIIVSNLFTRHLNRLRTTIKKIESGQLEERYDVRTRDEIGLLGKSFNLMVSRLVSSMEREVVLERRKEQAKLEALQAQINPHFLQNTLNTLKWMSIMAKTTSITEMLMALGHLLDVSIHRGQEKITVAEELENVRRFLVIQKYRFGETIRVREDIDPLTLDTQVPKLSMQPLVENVYSHSVFGESGGEVVIRSSLEGETVRLSVIDDGMGVAAERLNEVRQHLDDTGRGSFSRIGLKNVHQRIQMMYGPQYGLTIERDEEQGFTDVSITLPWKGEDQA
ncbi:two-component sensor histidine kinase [Paenibacillus sp. 598K]|uniref:cache domain-containing sensor histidine kinase n=1 Tax=Paenibacillus sp. 598K TaxID=1117987 RepID=UPI000FFA6F8C|nr:sensor histidine kinase [Paenibacillus sp. 598K]GBF76836.1 two-component sensor histidine kinase [Paenibacillus sp. 598K]